MPRLRLPGRAVRRQPEDGRVPQLREGGEARMAKAGMTVADMINRRDRQGMVERLIAAETDPERVLCPLEYERLILARKENDAARQAAHRLKKREGVDIKRTSSMQDYFDR